MSQSSSLVVVDARTCRRGGCGGTKTTLLTDDGWAVYIPNRVDGSWLRMEWPRILSDEIYMQTILKAMGIRTLVFEPCIVREHTKTASEEQAAAAPSHIDLETCRTRSFQYMADHNGEYAFDTKDWYRSPWIQQFASMRTNPLSLLKKKEDDTLPDLEEEDDTFSSSPSMNDVNIRRASMEKVFGKGANVNAVETTAALWRPVCDTLWEDVCRIAQAGIDLGSDSWNVMLVPVPKNNNSSSSLTAPSTTSSVYYQARFFAFDLSSKRYPNPRRIRVDENNTVHLPRNDDGTLKVVRPEQQWKSWAIGAFHHLVQDVVWGVCAPVDMVCIPENLQPLIAGIEALYDSL